MKFRIVKQELRNWSIEYCIQSYNDIDDEWSTYKDDIGRECIFGHVTTATKHFHELVNAYDDNGIIKETVILTS